jgi:hypothetical protein
MTDKPVALEPLFRCKTCSVRVFWRDAAGHMLRHGVETNGDLRKYFAKGPAIIPSVPGSLWKPNPRKKTKPKRP